MRTPGRQLRVASRVRVASWELLSERDYRISQRMQPQRGTNGGNLISCSPHPRHVPRIQCAMEYRLLGGSGLKVSALSFGAATFGGGNEFFKAWGETDVAEASRLIDLCIDAGVNLFDTADGYSDGRSEEILGKA